MSAARSGNSPAFRSAQRGLQKRLFDRLHRRNRARIVRLRALAGPLHNLHRALRGRSRICSCAARKLQSGLLSSHHASEGTVDFGIQLATSSHSWKVVKRAEELGFTHAWFYETQLLTADMFVAVGA